MKGVVQANFEAIQAVCLAESNIQNYVPEGTQIVVNAGFEHNGIGDPLNPSFTISKSQALDLLRRGLLDCLAPDQNEALKFMLLFQMFSKLNDWNV